MAKKDDTAKKAGDESVVASSGETELVMRSAGENSGKIQKAGEPGPASSLETGKGTPTGASAGGDTDFEGRRGSGDTSDGMDYDVQTHTDESGLEVLRISAKTGDEAAQKALAKKGYKGVSIRGVTPATDPDPNSLGGEREASIMLSNADNPIGGIDPLGTDANRKAVEKLGHSDIEELGQ